MSASGAGDSRERVRSYHSDYTFDSACDVTNTRHASQDKVKLFSTDADTQTLWTLVLARKR